MIREARYNIDEKTGGGGGEEITVILVLTSTDHSTIINY